MCEDGLLQDEDGLFWDEGLCEGGLLWDEGLCEDGLLWDEGLCEDGLLWDEGQDEWVWQGEDARQGDWVEYVGGVVGIISEKEKKKIKV